MKNFSASLLAAAKSGAAFYSLSPRHRYDVSLMLLDAFQVAARLDNTDSFS